MQLSMVEWVLAEQACYAQGAATVPLYDTLGADTVEFILNQTASPAVICGSKDEVANVLKVRVGGFGVGWVGKCSPTHPRTRPRPSSHSLSHIHTHT